MFLCVWHATNHLAKLLLLLHSERIERRDKEYTQCLLHNLKFKSKNSWSMLPYPFAVLSAWTLICTLIWNGKTVPLLETRHLHKRPQHYSRRLFVFFFSVVQQNHTSASSHMKSLASNPRRAGNYFIIRRTTRHAMCMCDKNICLSVASWSCAEVRSFCADSNGRLAKAFFFSIHFHLYLIDTKWNWNGHNIY